MWIRSALKRRSGGRRERSEENERHGVGHGGETGGRRMKVVAGIESGKKAVRAVGVAGDLVEVDEGIEVTRGANPLIHGLAIRFGCRPRMIELRSDEGENRGAYDLNAVSVGAGDELLVSGENAANVSVVFGRRDVVLASEHADIVDAFEKDEVADTCGSENIGVKTRESVGAEAIEEQSIAADALIDNGNGLRCGIGLEALGEQVRPAIVTVGGGAMSVGDGISEYDDGGGLRSGDNVDGGDEVPMFDFFRRGEFGRCNKIPMSEEGSSAGTGMTGLTGRRGVEIDGDGQIGKSRNGDRNSIGEVFGPGGNDYVGAARESESFVGGWHDGTGRRAGLGNMDR